MTVYTLNPLIIRDDLLLLYNRPENLSFFASPRNILSSRDEISEKDLDSVPLLLTPNEYSEVAEPPYLIK